jgi:type IV pilus assembly protein PilA
MFQRFHAMKEQREGGFTLIELLVVILIIAILAAIAIPVFLNQRKKGWISQMESALKNAATAQESCLTDTTCNAGEYADGVTALEGQGLKYAADVNWVSIVGNGSSSYVMTVSHDKIPGGTCTYVYDSAVGAPVKGAGAC